MTKPSPRPVLLADYRPPAYRVAKVALDIDLGDAQTLVKSRLEVARAGAEATPLVLDGEDLELRAVAIDGRRLKPADYRVDDAHLTLPPLDEAVVQIETVCRPRDNTRLEGLYVTGGVFCTQCEAQGFRRITYFIDRPDVMATYSTTLRAGRARAPVLLSNGNLVETRALARGRHLARWDDPFPKPCYLFALVAGDLAAVADSFTTRSGREVALSIFVEHGKEGRCAYAMEALKRAMRWDEEAYGLEYDLDRFHIVAVPDFNMGAMENKSLNIFNDKAILADPETATDADYATIESVVAHEYFHNWTGNRVTCRDWFQLSLKEGLTVFRERQFAAAMRSGPVQRIHDVAVLRTRQFAEDAGPLAHPVRPASYVEINNFYTATVYEKGAEVIGMIHSLLGADRFRRGMELYLSRHDGQAVTCDDFVAAIVEAGGVDLDQFRLWYAQAGTPTVAATGRYDPGARSYELILTQSVPPTPDAEAKRPMHVPLAVGLLDEAGRELPLRLDGEPASAVTPGRLLELREARHSYRFIDVPTPPVPSLNREFSAPVRLDFAYTPAQRALLMAHDSDPFNRWDAGQQFATALILAMIDELRAGREAQADATYLDACAALLADDSLDKALRAEALALPGEDYLALHMAVIDVDAIYRARESLRRQIAAALAEPIAAAYHANRGDGPFSPAPAEAARRALRNRMLFYLAVAPDADLRALVAAQYRDADNMTERLAPLVLLAEDATPARDAALDHFYRRFAGDPLVIDKWFAIQARAPAPGTLARVEALLGHPDFSPTNPNRVRALIGAFAGGNPVCFHSADGSGYRFIADRVIELDWVNPQVAARLLTTLGRWRRFDDARQALMRGELERILAAERLSPDVYEIASKSLG